jgi:Arc/MetJ-type ribon-helix-helix transcriptional regulator
MGSPNMTSVSVSFEARRQLNSMRAMGNYSSVDDLIQAVLQEYRMMQLRGEADKLRNRLREIGQTDVEALISRLGNSS